MKRAVAKGNFIKGKSGVKRAIAHVQYIEHRPGEDKDSGSREFFSARRDNIESGQIAERIQDQQVGRNDPVMHRVVLSPGLNSTDLKAYTRETMKELSDRKGQELEWFAISHRNTDHCHVHVCILGQAKDGSKVRLYKNDYKSIRAQGDYYLDREHGIERYLDSEAQRILDGKEYSTLDRKWFEEERLRAEGWWDKIEYGKDVDKEASSNALKDRIEWEFLEQKLKQPYYDKSGEINRMTGKQYQMEQSGKHLESHERAQSQIGREYFETLAKDRPDLAEYAKEELAALYESEAESLSDRFGKDSFDKLMWEIDTASEAERIDLEYAFKSEPFYDRIDVSEPLDGQEIEESGSSDEEREIEKDSDLEFLSDPEVEREAEESVARAFDPDREDSPDRETNASEKDERDSEGPEPSKAEPEVSTEKTLDEAKVEFDMQGFDVSKEAAESERDDDDRSDELGG